MSKYTLDFKYQTVRYYRRVHSQQRTTDHFNISRPHLRRRIAAYNQGSIRAPEHLQAMMTVKRENPFIVDKPDHEKTQAELIEELLSTSPFLRQLKTGVFQLFPIKPRCKKS